MLVALVVVVVGLAVLWLVSAPLRPGYAIRVTTAEEAERDELEARKEAKYREIRDAELDHRMGKTSREDWRAIDRGLRAEAIDVLKALDRLEGRDGGESKPAPEPAASARIEA